jgi:hypothetical protein
MRILAGRIYDRNREYDPLISDTDTLHIPVKQSSDSD